MTGVGAGFSLLGPNLARLERRCANATAVSGRALRYHLRYQTSLWALFAPGKTKAS